MTQVSRRGCELTSNTSIILLNITSILPYLLCLEDSPSLYRIVCGEHDLDSTEGGEAVMPVTEVRVHQDYRGASLGRDIAVFKVDDSALRGRIKRGGSIYPVCLPRVDEDYFEDRLNVAGWGITSERKIRVRKGESGL